MKKRLFTMLAVIAGLSVVLGCGKTEKMDAAQIYELFGDVWHDSR